MQAKFIFLFIFSVCIVGVTLAQKTPNAIMPQFPGGTDSLRAYLSTHINYPPTATQDSVRGKVIVQFYVEKTGEITNVSVIKGIRPDIDKEAIRVIKEMPRWKRGTDRAIYKMPINFSLKKN